MAHGMRCFKRIIFISTAPLLIGLAVASSPKQSMMASSNDHIEIIDLNPSSFANNFYESWEKSFPQEESPLFKYSAKDNPEQTLLAVHDAFAFVSKWLPSSVVARLASFPFQKAGSSAILIRGFPIDKGVPPTPIKSSVYDDSQNDKTDADQSTLVPVAESWLLGVSRILGMPMGAPFSKGDRGGLVRDITQNDNDIDDLPMHRDYPTVAQDPKLGVFEPEIFILFGVRSDLDDSGAKTVVMDSNKLLQIMDEEDAALLRVTKIQTELKLDSGEYFPFGLPFHPIIDNDDDGTSTVTLYAIPNAQHVSPDGGTKTVEAYTRMSQLAFDKGTRVNLKPGDMLIIQNSRLVHGRTKFHSPGSCVDSGRWLVKTYVTNRLWSVPGGESSSSSGGHTEYPNLNPMGWNGIPRRK